MGWPRRSAPPPARGAMRWSGSPENWMARRRERTRQRCGCSPARSGTSRPSRGDVLIRRWVRRGASECVAPHSLAPRPFNQGGALTADVDRLAYPFESRWMPLRAGRMHYVDQGTGDPIVFVHGTPTWSFEWRHLIRGLSKSARCIAPDHLGFGLSDRPHGAPYTPEWHAEN